MARTPLLSMSYLLLSSRYSPLMHLLLPLHACNRPWLTPDFLPSMLLLFFSVSVTIFFILSLQCCLACFALLFHLISYSRSFSQNPCCLFLNLSIFPSLSLLHICVPPHVPWCFYETFTCELQKGCGQSIPEGGVVEALIRKAGSQRGPQPSWDIS